MISYHMYKLLRIIPPYPQSIPAEKACRKSRLKKDRFDFLLRTAIDNDYIFYAARKNPDKPLLYLNEIGVLAVEEFKGKHSAAQKSTIPLIISGLSLFASIAAIVISYIW